MDSCCTVGIYVVYFGSCLKSEWLPRLINTEETYIGRSISLVTYTYLSIHHSGNEYNPNIEFH